MGNTGKYFSRTLHPNAHHILWFLRLFFIKILNAQRVTIHIILSAVVRQRNITKFSSTPLCLSTNASCATSHASVPGSLQLVRSECPVWDCELLPFRYTQENSRNFAAHPRNYSIPSNVTMLEIFNALRTQTLDSLITLVLLINLDYISHGKYLVSTSHLLWATHLHFIHCTSVDFKTQRCHRARAHINFWL